MGKSFATMVAAPRRLLDSTETAQALGFDTLADQVLVKKCLGCEDGAWSCLVGRYHARLKGFIAFALESRNMDFQSDEDLTQEFWLSLVQNDFARLKAYDPMRGSLISYLMAIAFQRVLQHGRLRPRRRPIPLDHCPAEKLQFLEVPLGAIMAEIVTTLSGQERAFFEASVGGWPGDFSPLAWSGGNRRVLKHRISQRIHDYLLPK